MAETKTKPTATSVETFIDSVKSAQKRDDARALCRLMEKVSGEPPTMWGASIIGFGRYHYRYESGHEGDICRMGFSPRASALTLYINKGSPRSANLLSRLGKHKESKACLYINKLADVDQAVLAEMIEEGWKTSAEGCDVC